MWRWEDVKMRRCEDEKVWRWEDVKMRRCEDEQMWRWEDEKMWEKVWRWEGVKMRRCEDEKMRYRPPLLEEPCAQTLSGKIMIFHSYVSLPEGTSTWLCHVISVISIRHTLWTKSWMGPEAPAWHYDMILWGDVSTKSSVLTKRQVFLFCGHKFRSVPRFGWYFWDQ